MQSSGIEYKFGVRVEVAGRAKGTAALDNEDGTWNIEFDDDTEGNIPTCEITVIEGTASDLVLGNTRSPSALIIWLHGRTDAPDGWARHFESYLAGLLPYTRIDLPCAEHQVSSCQPGKKVTSWFDIKALPMNLTRSDDGIGQADAIARILRIVDDAVASGIDPRRIVLGGHSQGGAVALAATLQARVGIGACVVLATWAMPAQRLEDCVTTCPAAAEGTRFFVCHGDADATVLLECGEYISALLQNGGCNIRFEVFPGMGHAGCQEFVERLRDFLLNVLAAAP